MGSSRMLGCVLAIGIAVLPAVGQASAIQEGIADGPTVNVIFGKVKNKVQKAFSHGLPQVDFHRGFRRTGTRVGDVSILSVWVSGWK